MLISLGSATFCCAKCRMLPSVAVLAAQGLGIVMLPARISPAHERRTTVVVRGLPAKSIT